MEVTIRKYYAKSIKELKKHIGICCNYYIVINSSSNM